MRFLAVALSVVAVVGITPTNWHTFHANRIRVRYPLGWFATARPLTAVTGPRQILAVASYRFRPDIAHADGCEPKEAFDRLPLRGAFIFGWEAGRVGYDPGVRLNDFPLRPKYFKLSGFGRYDCLGTAPGYLLRFSDNGRAFMVEIAFGKKASRATRATVLRILDSFSATRR